MPAEITSRVCSRCGEDKPLSEFDRRFVFKDSKVSCQGCRDKRDREWHERLKKRLADPVYQEELLRRREAWRQSWAAELERQRQEMIQAAEARTQLVYAWIRQHAKHDLDDDDCRGLLHCHHDLHRSGHTWTDVRASFQALDPPYAAAGRRTWRATKETQARIYREQQGTCYYCARKLAPLGSHSTSHGSRDGDDERDREFTHVFHPHYPELDHLVPVSRGGSNERENLAFACRGCNQRKSIRTASEFAAMPNDPISRLPMGAGLIDVGTWYEEQGYTGFSEPWPF
jgi:5-methylcytosine-specific restriction endonuclease McrA